MSNPKVINATNRQVGLLSPVSWAIFWWLVFQHVTVPDWVSTVAFTLLAVAGLALTIHWFKEDTAELIFHQDGKVTWK